MKRSMLFVLLLVLGCGSVRAPGRGATTSDLLTRAEIAQSSATNAYDLLQQLRPQFLRSRGVLSIRDPRPAYPIVYVESILHGDLNSLRSIRVDEIDEVRFVSASDATTRWGTGHSAGVIQISISH